MRQPQPDVSIDAAPTGATNGHQDRWPFPTARFDRDNRPLNGAVQGAASSNRGGQKVRTAQQQLEVVERVAHIGSWDYRAAEGTLRASDGLCAILNCPSETTGFDLDRLLGHVHPDDRSWVGQEIEEAIENPATVSVVCRVCLPDRGERIVHVHGELGWLHDHFAFAHGTVQDLTAEGVGDEKTLHTLLRLGVRYAQGYHVDHPAPALAARAVPALVNARQMVAADAAEAKTKGNGRPHPARPGDLRELTPPEKAPNGQNGRPADVSSGGAGDQLILTAEEVADRYKLSPNTVYRAIRDGRLRAARLGHQFRIRADEAAAWWDESTA